MDLSCYNPETVPTMYRNSLSHGDFEGAMAKSAVERGLFHTWSQNIAKTIVLNSQVTWYAEHSWFNLFAKTDTFLNKGSRNQDQAQEESQSSGGSYVGPDEEEGRTG